MNSKFRTSGGQQALPREFICSSRIFDKETEKVFSKHWLYVCRETELGENGCYRTSVRQSNIVLIRGEDDQIRAFHNFCRHRGSELVTESGCSSIGKRLQCPYHAWTYNRQGDLVSAPNMSNDDEFDKQSYGLKTIHCETWHGFVFICFDDPKEPLADFLKPMESHANQWSYKKLFVAEQIEYEVQANWKLIFQNYSECYHCPIVHPALNQLTPFKGASNDLENGAILGGPMQLSDDSQTMSTDGKLTGLVLPNLSDEAKKMVSYYTLFPSLFLSNHPDYVLLHRIDRIESGITKIICQFLYHPDSQTNETFDPKPAVEFWDMTNQQDWNVCELAQRGIEDISYEPGPYSDLESVVAEFDKFYRSQMDENFGDRSNFGFPT